MKKPFFRTATIATIVVLAFITCNDDMVNGGTNSDLNSFLDQFQPTRTVTLTVDRNPTAGGTTTPSSSQSVTAGTPVSISASASSGYRFVNWTVTSGTATFGNSSNANTTVTLSSNATIRANFEQTTTTVTLTVNRSPTAGGTTTPSSSQSVTAGSPFSISASAASGYRFVNWTVTNGTATFGNSSNANTTVTLSSNATIRANFQLLPGGQFNPSISYGSFTDSRDGQTYRTVTIGTQTWMAENLNWAGVGGDLGWCSGNNASNCDLYGRLYDWSTVMGLPSSCNSRSCASQVQSPHQGICPSGWHVPSDAEWTTLVNFVGSSTAGTQLKAMPPYWNGSDTHGFSALPGGSRYTGGAAFWDVGSGGAWWSATEHGAAIARYRVMYPSHSGVGTNWDGKAYGFSLRCAQDVRP
jgi:uncharacterized protein (TIGR02145 family)